MTRAAVFAHYDADGIVDTYVLAYLGALRQLVDHLVCVSAAPLLPEEEKKLTSFCDRLIVRPNEGYDFMSYKEGLATLDVGSYDQIVLCNDSVYGPMFDLSEVFEEMARRRCDVWGMTESKEITPHLQSYFLVFERPALQSPAFESFWSKVGILSAKEEVILRYEAGLSTALSRGELTWCAYADASLPLWHHARFLLGKLTPARVWNRLRRYLSPTSSLPATAHVNPTLMLWKPLLEESRMPFVKISLLRDLPYGVSREEILQAIEHHTSYDTELIRTHLRRILSKESRA